MPRRKISFRYNDYEKVTQPNFQQIAELVKLAKGDKNIKEFAEACDVSPSLMSIILSGKTTSSLSDQVIKSITENADPEIALSAEMLLEANGMAKKVGGDNVKVTVKSAIHKVDDSPMRFGTHFEELSRELICAKLLSKRYTISQNFEPTIFDCGFTMLRPDFEFEIRTSERGETRRWCFDTILTNGLIFSERIYHKLSTVLGAAYLSRFTEKGIMFSFVIDSRELFDEIKAHFENHKIDDYISIVLIDTVGRRIIDEYVLPTTNTPVLYINN